MSDNLRTYFFNKNMVERLYKKLFIPITKIEDISIATQYTKYIFNTNIDKEKILCIGIYSIEDINNIVLINNINFILQAINSLIKGSLSIDITLNKLNEESIKRFHNERIDISVDNLHLMSKIYPNFERLNDIYKGLKSLNPTIPFTLVKSNISLTEGFINPANKTFIRMIIKFSKDDKNYINFANIDLMADYTSRIKELNCSINNNISYKDVFIPPLDIPYKSLLIKIDKSLNLLDIDIIKFCNSLIKKYESEFQFIDVSNDTNSLNVDEVSSYSHYTFINNTSVLSGHSDIKSIQS